MRRQPLDKLPDHPLLSALSAEQLDRLLKGSERVEIDANETLFNMGETASRFYMVESGQVKIFRVSPNGQEKVLELMQSGRTFAEAAMFMENPRYPANCAALTHSQVVALNAGIFMDILSESPDTAIRLLAGMSMKLRARIADIESLAFQNATLRVVGFLLGLVPASQDISEIALPFSKKMIAARLSLQPETLSRVFAKLTSQGLLVVDGDTLYLPRLDDLRALTWTS
ncbi:Crp/Fnr family transcriptional regulator [Marinihelvus fidelis]|uniref:Crp/Fnr family transcriptional regulator n=1 Tax=Marinihelvus fidelis TaxID=2613842 RepID=A0A5N0T8S3_9GAMM|nr:Crp/Fnr family transcriptional regulator [Marinihelvus fidelis]KAA9131433.1 Crp/Fnr family transcriptional regulator [Marinihelvus fidelis]